MSASTQDGGSDDHVCVVTAGYVKPVTVRQSITICRGDDGKIGVLAERNGHQVEIVLANDKARALAEGLARVLAL